MTHVSGCSSGSNISLAESSFAAARELHFCKRRHGDRSSNHKQSAKQKSTAHNASAHRDPVLADDSLTELGITGFLSDYENDSSDELSTVFPVLSQDCCTDTSSPCKRLCVAPPSQVSSLYQPELADDKPIGIFDSPEEGRRGWSELGLKLRKPAVKAARSKLDIEEGEGYMTHLADEILLAIFSYMPKRILAKCARVCQRWRRLAYDESLWRRLDMGGKVVGDAVLGPILCRGVEYLRLASAEVIGDRICEPLYDLRPSRVQYLDLSMATISVQCLDLLFSHCKQLRKLSLENLTVNSNVCRGISQNLQLTTLNCSMVSGLTYSGIRHVLRSCTLLEELNLAWVGLPADDVRSVLSNLPCRLHRLNMAGCREHIEDSDVKALVTAAPHLQELDLSDALGLTALSLHYIHKALIHLQVLHLSRCYYIVPEAFSCLSTLRQLTHLSIHSMMTDENLLAVIDHLPSVTLNTLYLSTIARPTVGIYRTSIWGHRVRDIPV